MSKSYKEITEGLNPYLAEVKKGVPEVMSELNDLELETALTVKWIERNGSAYIVKSLAKANRKALDKFPLNCFSKSK